MKRILSTSILAFSLLSGSMVFADSHHKCGCATMEKMAHELDLTAEQKAKIEAIKKQSSEMIKVKKQEKKALKKEMKHYAASDSFDENKLNEMVAKKKELSAEITKEKMMMKHRIYMVLDAKQKEKYKHMLDD